MSCVPEQSTAACLCHSGVPNYVQTYGQELVLYEGQAQATTMVTNAVRSQFAERFNYRNAWHLPDHISQIDNSKTKSNCVYPDNSIAACSAQNLCGFTCNAPSVLCNGQCVASGLCPSSQAVSKKRSRVGIDSCTQMGPAWATCGVLGGGPRAWECINTANDLESCKCLPCLCLTAAVKLTDLAGSSPKRWWLHVPSYGLLSHWRGLLDAPWRCRCFLSVGRMRRPPLPTRIRARVRWHELHPQTPLFAISIWRSGGRACAGLWSRARYPQKALSSGFDPTFPFAP
jgi:hypothetical protein